MGSSTYAREHEGLSPAAQEDLLAALARVEAILRAVNRGSLEEAFPKEWMKGRKRKILDFCTEPRTQQEIRDHVGSIAGYEVRDYLAEGLRYGVLASYRSGVCLRYVTVLLPPADARPRKPDRKATRTGDG